MTVPKHVSVTKPSDEFVDERFMVDQSIWINMDGMKKSIKNIYSHICDMAVYVSVCIVFLFFVWMIVMFILILNDVLYGLVLLVILVVFIQINIQRKKNKTGKVN